MQGLLAEGITSAGSIQNFRFFTNDFETTTQGIDVVATYTAGNTDVHLLFNHTDTEVTDFNPDTLSESRIQQLEEALPKTRAALSAHPDAQQAPAARPRQHLQRLVRLRRLPSPTTAATSSWISEASYNLGKHITLVAGGQNIFNHYPDENPGARAGVGNLYSQYTPFGFNGAFWYGRIKYDF